VSSFLTAHQHS